MNLNTLYHKGKGGAVYSWRVWTEGPDVVSEYGQVGGQKVTARRTCEAKNVGRSNATTPEQQAELEAKSDWQNKRDRKYHETVEAANTRKIAVMKAPTKGFKDTKKYAVYPLDVQPKLDGARCLAYWEGDRIVLLTRGQKEWNNLDHIKAQLAKIMPTDAMFDGELYFHGVKRQTIQKWITKKYPETAQVEFHVYDIPVADGEEKPWSDRRLDLDRFVPGDPGKSHPDTPHIVKVLTLEVQSEEQVMLFQSGCIDGGFEGCMVRNRKGTYDWGHRSNNLLKVKTFDDAEFEVVGFKDGTGKNVGIVTWTCKTKEGKIFDCDPLGSYEERAEFFRNGNSYIGKLLTVKFQGVSNDGIPQFPKGVAFRLPEDMDAAGSGDED